LNAASPEAARLKSLKLGICQQALLLRLPASSPESLARLLADPSLAPRATRPTLERLLSLQRHRNLLGSAWKGFFSSQSLKTALCETSPATTKTRWTGHPVHPGVFSGKYWVAPAVLNGEARLPPGIEIIVFSQARPDAVMLFEQARAVAFGKGGVLSHACSVARERGIICITGLGRDFVAEARARVATAQLGIEVHADAESTATFQGPR
jgi:phosphohistidine swiveling domain-containing protein